MEKNRFLFCDPVSNMMIRSEISHSLRFCQLFLVAPSRYYSGIYRLDFPAGSGSVFVICFAGQTFYRTFSAGTSVAWFLIMMSHIFPGPVASTDSCYLY